MLRVGTEKMTVMSASPLKENEVQILETARLQQSVQSNTKLLLFVHPFNRQDFNISWLEVCVLLGLYYR
jgi:hypothetical protein